MEGNEKNVILARIARTVMSREIWLSLQLVVAIALVKIICRITQMIKGHNLMDLAFFVLKMYLSCTEIHVQCSLVKPPPSVQSVVWRGVRPIIQQSDKYFISLKVNTITCVIWGQKPNRLLTKDRSRTSETRFHRRTNNWQGHTRTQKTHIWTTRTS